jgi:hypothetical protein
MSNIEIESLLFKQVKRPKNYSITKSINLWENRYRINVYTEIFDPKDKLSKRKIQNSYFCHYEPGNLKILNL